VHALAFERVQVNRQGRDERLAFARLHLGDPAVMQHHSAQELHVVVPHLERALAGFAAHCERLGQDVVERRAVVELLLELSRLGFDLGVAELRNFWLERIDRDDLGTQATDRPLVRGSEELFGNPGDHAGAPGT
jgi:hypothetical protein